ncbi:MAG: glycosyltransferase family 2 protein [Acidipropionibacterium acidipropionici]|jgi:N-acetylglucosaminyl-diphospho-decaprenol L-rhamnosyltransferase|uniref:glycosyltransferase family 2 protein n=1 Tax=Acidipropionibacterium acidipropionici TaxID=1748 RepID=UPI002F350D01
MMRTLSVVIPHYGDPEPTLALVESLRRQRGAGDFEIVIADDCSPYPLPEGDGYRLVRRATNGGYGSACNAGAAIVTGDDILFLNSDLSIADDFIAGLRAAAEPWLPAVVGPRIIQDGRTVPVARRWPRAQHHVIEWLMPLARFHGRSSYERLAGTDLGAWRSRHAVVTDWVVGVAHLVPSDQFRAVGGFDEGFFMNCEEVDLHRRLYMECGVRAVYLPKVCASHAGGGSSDPAKRVGWVTDSRFAYAHKWRWDIRLGLGMMAATGINLVWNAARRLRGGEVEPLAEVRRQVAILRHAWMGRKR